MSDATTTTEETRRDRVRRLFIHPMQELGWRKPGNVRAEDHEAMLVSLCDRLAYLSDESFAVLRQNLRVRGAGKDHDLWPRPAIILALANLVQYRPLTEVPAVLRWFRSRAGTDADANGRLVEEYGFWLRYNRPPANASEHKIVADRAVRNRARVDLCHDRRRRDIDPGPGEAEWVERYLAREAELRQLVRGEGAQ